MSPLWRDETGVYLSSHRLCVVRMGRGMRPKLLGEEQHTLSTESSGWEAAIGALSRRFGAPDWSGTRVRAVVADQWVRYAIVPWSESLRAPEEQMGHARALLEGTFGDGLVDWTMILSDAAPGETRLACAMPNALLDSLRGAARAHGQELISVQPQLIAAYNTWRHRLPVGRSAWFVTVEHGTLAALRTSVEGINRVHCVRIGPDWGRELKRLHTFNRLASKRPAQGHVYVDVPRSMRLNLPELSTDLQWLDDAEPPLTTLHQLENVRRKSA